MRRNKITACTLATVLGLSGAVYPVHAEKIQIINASELGDSLEVSKENDIQPYVINNAGDFNVEGGTSGTDWTYDSGNNTLTFNNSGNYKIVGNGVKTQEKIVVNDNFNGTITIKNVNVNVDNQNSTSAFNIAGTANLILNIEGVNIFRSGWHQSGITFNNASNGSLCIKSDSGDGKLEAYGIIGAGIGGSNGKSGNNITIESGNIIAKGDWQGAGIGGGFSSSGNNIIINGGTVTAISGVGKAIGGGQGGNASNIQIKGGSVKAICNDENSIGTTPTDGNGNDVYLCKIDDLSGINDIMVDSQSYIRNGDHPDNDVIDGTFYLYLTKEEHTISANGKTYYVYWNEQEKNFKFKNSNPNTPTVEIDTKTSDSITVKELENQDIYGKAEYSLDNQTWQDSNVFTGLDANKEYTIYARYKGNDSYIESGVGNVSVTTEKAEQQAPIVIGGIGSTINNTTTSMEYADSENATTWTTCTDGTTEVNEGTWYVRYKETDTQKASPTTEVAVVAPTYTITSSSNDLEFDPKNEGYNTEGLSKTVTITNEGNSKVTLQTPISSEKDSKFNFSLSTNKLESQGTATLTVTPKENLTEGTYNEKITITTEQGTSVEINAEFKVNSVYVPPTPSKPDENIKINIADRISGETRYDTSIAISKKAYPSKSEKVYIVSGEKFPDALSTASLTRKGDGPILLINDKNIDKVLSEIDRLDAKKIVFVGGNSIADVNESKIQKFAKENSATIKTFAGEDRYETAIKVAEQTIEKYGNKGKVIIADGRNYPDAVSIAPYAAKEEIPVILVNGNKVPDVVKSFLDKCKIKEAIFVGGDKAVGKDVEKLFAKVERIAGEDRYETSKKIAERFFAGSKNVILASGESFADSLSVSYYAEMKNAPVLLTKSNSLDESTEEYLNNNKYKDYIIVGGEEAVDSEIFE